MTVARKTAQVTPGGSGSNPNDQGSGEVQQMKAIAIKKGHSREKRRGSMKWERSGVRAVARSFSSVTIPSSWISGSLRDKHIDSKRSLLRSTSARRNMQIESNCRTDLHELCAIRACQFTTYYSLVHKDSSL
jgi:WD40 repeat protein